MSNNTSVSIPQQSRRMRRRLIPLLVWIGAIVIFIAGNQQQSQYQYAIGIVESDEVSVAPLSDGTIRSVRVDIFDTIEAGEIVAMMDDTLIVAELAIEEAQLAQLRAELDVERTRVESDIELGSLEQLDDLRRYQLDEEKARLEQVEISVDVESNQVKLERLKIQMERQEQLVNEAIGDVSTYDDIRLRYTEVKEELASDQKTLALAKKNVEETTRRRVQRQQQTSEPVQNTLLYLEPFLQELKVQEARRQEIQQERMTLVLRAPISGKISKKFYGPGETLLSGTPLLSIQSPNGNRAIAYVNEVSVVGITPDTEVQLRSTTRPGVMAKAQVLRTGSGLEELPRRVWSTPIIAEWGIPVLIGGIPDGVFFPSETVSVRFK